MDDLVIRLCKQGEWEPVGDGTKYWEPSAICIEAAEEIQRLLRVIAQLRTECDQWANRALSNGH